MVTLSRNGAQHRTKLMGQEQAERFARCLKANPRFDGVFVSESTRSAGKWFVAYVPSNLDRRAELLQQKQDERQERAVAQAGNYEFILPTESNGRWTYCLNLVSGEVYETSEYSCNCPDAEYRCRPAGIRCKHSLMLAEALQRGEVKAW